MPCYHENRKLNKEKTIGNIEFLKERITILNAEKTIDLKKSLTKVALLGALGLGATTAATLNSQTANASTDVDATHLRVDAGDTLYKIAQEKGTTVDKLAAENHISNPNMIIAGQILTTEGNGTASAQNVQTPVAAQQTPTTTTHQAVQQPVQQQAASTQTQTANNSGYQAPAASTSSNYAAASNYTSNVSGSEASAKAWIASHESGGNYNATNGQYIGKYQLSASYLNGDYSPANQERVADQYVAQRYGSWQNAQAHWMSNGWY